MCLLIVYRDGTLLLDGVWLLQDRMGMRSVLTTVPGPASMTYPAPAYPVASYPQTEVDYKIPMAAY